MSPETAAESVGAALEASHQVRTALEVLSLLPTVASGEPRAVFLLVARLQLANRLGCVQTSVEAVDASADALVLHFEPGCRVDERTISGDARVVLRSGEDQLDVEADLRQLLVDGEPVNARVGYGVVGDERRVWAASEGTLPRRPDVRYVVDMRLGVQDSGLPLLGSTTLVLDGEAKLVRGAAVDGVGFEALEYEVGDYLPKGGALSMQTGDGHAVHARFSSVFWKLGKAQVAVDGGPEVAVPIVH